MSSGDDFRHKAASLVEDMQRELQERVLAQLDAAAGTVSAAPGPTCADVKAGMDRCAELIREMRDVPELRFHQTRHVPRGQMFELKELQHDRETGQTSRLVIIHPDDAAVVRAALLTQMAPRPSVLMPLLPLGLEREA